MSIDCRQINPTLIQLCYFLFGTLCISVRSGYSITPIILAVLGLYFLLKKYSKDILSFDSRILIYIFSAYFVIQGISILWDGGQIKELDRPSRALMAILILITALRYPPRFLWLMNGFAIGAIGAGLHAIWDRKVAGLERAFEWMMPIQGGDISMSLGIISLCALMWAIKKSKKIYILLYSIATLMGIYGSILSQSRGGWILFPVILLITYQLFKPWINKKSKISLILGLISLAIFCSLPQTGITKRFLDAKNDITAYMSGDVKADNSVGLRFEFWKSAIISFSEKPIFGWGNHGVRESQTKQYQSAVISKAAYEFNGHAHNQFLDEMAKRGLIGLITLIAFFYIPLLLFKKRLHVDVSDQDRVTAACGILLIFSTIDYCLSQAFFNHNSGIVFYSVTVILLYSCTKKEEKS